MRRSLIGSTVIGIMVSVLAVSPTLAQWELIAHYPLDHDSTDATGNYDPIELINTPYEEIGIYCNGNYFQGEPNPCSAETPEITDLDFESLSISASFKLTEPLDRDRPVFVGGHFWRWLGFYLSTDGVVWLMYNNGNGVWSETEYQLNTWHAATVTYDGSSDLASLYLDGELAISQEFELLHGNIRDVSITDFSNGNVFRGIFSDLRIYNGIVSSDEIANPRPSTPILLTVYPNPCDQSATISFFIHGSGPVDLSIWDLTGRRLARLGDRTLGLGEHQVTWNPRGLPAGAYIVCLRTPEWLVSRRLLAMGCQ